MRIKLQAWLAHVRLMYSCLLGLGSALGMKLSSYACSHRVILYERNCIGRAQDGSKWAQAIQSGNIREVAWTSGPARVLASSTFDRALVLTDLLSLGRDRNGWMIADAVI